MRDTKQNPAKAALYDRAARLARQLRNALESIRDLEGSACDSGIGLTQMSLGDTIEWLQCRADSFGAGQPRQMSEQDLRAWDDDEADMARIAREWMEFDRDPPGS